MSAETYDLTDFGLGEMTRCCAALRGCGTDAPSIEVVADRIVRHLAERMCDQSAPANAC